MGEEERVQKRGARKGVIARGREGKEKGKVREEGREKRRGKRREKEDK